MQWIERWTSNPKVPGSNPGWDNILYRNNIDQKFIFVQFYKNSIVCNKNVGKIISEKNLGEMVPYWLIRSSKGFEKNRQKIYS